MSDRFELGNGHELVTADGRVLLDGKPITVRELTRRYPAKGRVWGWLRQHGLRRVSTTSGPSGQTRNRVKKRLSISQEDERRLDALAARLGCTASEVVSRALVAFEKALK